MRTKRIVSIGLIALAFGLGACTPVAGDDTNQPAQVEESPMIVEGGTLHLSGGVHATLLSVGDAGQVGYFQCVVVDNGYVRPAIAISCVP